MSRRQGPKRQRSLEKLGEELTKLRTALDKAYRQYHHPEKNEDIEDAIRMNLIRIHEAMTKIRKMEQDFWSLFCEGAEINLKNFRIPLAHGNDIKPEALDALMEQYIEPLRSAIRLTTIATFDSNTDSWSGHINKETTDEWKERLNEEDTLKAKVTIISLSSKGRFDVLRVAMKGDKEKKVLHTLELYGGRGEHRQIQILAR